MKTAFFPGTTGQNGICLAAALVGKGGEVHEIKRHAAHLNTPCFDHILAGADRINI